MEKRRPLTFAASIMNIVAFSIYIILTGFISYITFFTFLLLLDFAKNAEASVWISVISLIVSCIARFALSITSIVLSAKLIKVSKANEKDFAANKTLKATIFINTFIVVYGILSYIDSFQLGGEMETLSLILTIIEVLMFVIMIIVITLLSVDLNKNKKALATQAQQTTTPSTPEVETKNVAEEQIDELAKLNKMKEEGLISDEEYEKMKSDIIK